MLDKNNPLYRICNFIDRIPEKIVCCNPFNLFCCAFIYFKFVSE
jgi:hypothetical protein